MVVAEKKERLEKWTAKLPFLEPYVVKADNVLEHTGNVDALCWSLVKDCLVCNKLSEKYGRKASMLPARDNMLDKADIRVEGHDGKLSDGKSEVDASAVSEFMLGCVLRGLA